MGEVYRATDTKLGRDVAIKVLPSELARDPERLARFQREARLLASLNHPNIAHVYGFESAAPPDGPATHFLAMELVEGADLAERLKHGAIPVDEAVAIARQVAEALEEAHEHGIVHRDLKPANVKVTEDGKVKVLDFGLAKKTEIVEADPEMPTSAGKQQLTRTGSIMGTVAYMSPEQARGNELDARTDLFSLGAVLYEMATGVLPFGGRTTGEMLEAVFIRKPVPAGRLNANIPAKLEEIISKALEKDRNLRYQSASEIRADLQRLNRERTLPHAALLPASGAERAAKSSTAIHGMRYGIIAVIAVLLAITALYIGSLKNPPQQRVEAPGAQKSKIAIAVLPFSNMSAEKDQEYFSDGLTEELTDALARNPKLRVTSRTSAFSFKGKEVDIKTIADRLNVTHVVEGSVRKAGNQLRVAAKLIEVATDSQIWSETYDRQLENIFAVQDDIAGSVAGALKVALEGSNVPKTQPTNLEAYNAYLQGRYFSDRRRKEDLEKAINYYERALQLDPSYSQAWTSLSEAHSRQADNGYMPVDEAYASARKEAEKALALDPNLAAAHVQMGWIQMNYDWDWSAADASYQRALALEPANADVFRGAALLASTLGRFDEAITLGRRAIELDPLLIATYNNLALHSYRAGRLREAEQVFHKALELSPQYLVAHASLGLVYLAQSKPEAALAEIRKEPVPVYRQQGLALAYHALGKEKESDAELAGFIEKYQNESAFQIAEIYAYRGEKDKAFDWLGRAYEQRDGGLTEMKGDPLLRSLEQDPRWHAFLKKMKLPLE